MTISLFPLEDVCSSRITRRESPPRTKATKDYGYCKEYLRRDFEHRCAYCMIHEDKAGGSECFEIDHFHPVSRGGSTTNYSNLYWSCRGCNSRKSNTWPSEPERESGYRFLDPCAEHDYGQHILEDYFGRLIPQTNEATYHIGYLLLNRESRRKLRYERIDLQRRLDELQQYIQDNALKAHSPQEHEQLNLITGQIDYLKEALRTAIPLIAIMSKSNLAETAI